MMNRKKYLKAPLEKTLIFFLVLSFMLFVMIDDFNLSIQTVLFFGLIILCDYLIIKLLYQYGKIFQKMFIECNEDDENYIL